MINHVKSLRRHLVGICAGYQMLGERLLDPEGLESHHAAELHGLALLPTETRFTAHKRTVRVQGTSALYGTAVGDGLHDIHGYEIHMGRTSYTHPVVSPFTVADADETPHGDGASAYDGRVWGTYVHGILHNDELRRAWLNDIRTAKGLEPLPSQVRFRERRERAFDRLAEHVRAHLDVRRIYEMMGLTALQNGGHIG